MKPRENGWLWLVAAVLVIAAGCSSQESKLSSTGTVQLVAVVKQAASGADVTRVEVAVTAPDMDTVTGSLTKTGGTWSGTLGPIPAGSGRTFTAEAYDGTRTKLYSGKATDVVITSEQTAVVTLTLQDLNPKPEFTNFVPLITSLVASTHRVAPGGEVSLQASAMDYDSSDTLTYAWTASAGSFDSTSEASTTWTAVGATGATTLTLTVTDSRGAASAISLPLHVEAPGTGTDGGTHGIDVSAAFNTWPQVTSITTSSAYVELGETTTLSVAATDADGDALSYAWSTSSSGGCYGSWTGANSATAHFTPEEPAPHSGSQGCGGCQLFVSVQDGRGGQTRGSLSICVGPKPAARFPPRISGTWQSAPTVPAGGTATFRVTVSDPQASALSYQWSSSLGVLGGQSDSIASSEISWRAPSCVPASGPTLGVTATVRNAHGLTATHAFSITLSSGAPCPPSGWSTTDELSQARSAHTATILSSGQVLVVGGDIGGGVGTATAERYDPITNTWSSAASMARARWGHTATVLLSGQVLVAGGRDGSTYLSGAELYNPLTGTWTATGSMSRPRAHHAAVLLPSGQVLVSGGAFSSDSYSTSMEVYDPASGTWTLLSGGGMSSPRGEHVMLLLPSGWVVTLLGRTQYGPVGSIDFYDPRTGNWASSHDPYMGSHDRGTATVLSSGQVLVAGGTWAGSNASLLNLSMHGGGYPSPTGPMSMARSEHVAVRLSSEQVLVMGGRSPQGDSIASAELYDPDARSWSLAGSMSVSRYRHTATVLPSGQVLVVGGAGSDGPLASVELFTP